MIVFTSICMNYMPKALVLGESLKKHNPDIKFYICLVEREMPKCEDETINKIVDKIILAKDLGFDDFDKFIFKHDIVEASTAVKGRAICHLYDTEEDDKIVYIDPDIKVFNKFDNLSSLLDEHEIILTPHLSAPDKELFGIQYSELSALKHGVYNLGFLAIRRGEESNKLIRFWENRLSIFCYDDIPNGIFTDQKWMDLAPAFFDVHILKQPGYNMASWNISNRRLSKEGDTLIVNNQEPLYFFHFSGYDKNADVPIIGFYIKDKDALEYKIKEEYTKDLQRHYQDTMGKTPWSYANYFNGNKIARQSRITYRNYGMYKWIGDNPFNLSDEYFDNYLQAELTKNNPPVINTKFAKTKRIINKIDKTGIIKNIYHKIKK